MARHPLASRATGVDCLQRQPLVPSAAATLRAWHSVSEQRWQHSRWEAGAQHTSTQIPCTCSYWRREEAGGCTATLLWAQPPAPRQLYLLVNSRFSVDMLHLGRQLGAPLTPCPARPNNTQELQGRAAQLGAPAAAVRPTGSTQPRSARRAGRRRRCTDVGYTDVAICVLLRFPFRGLNAPVAAQP